MSSPNFVDSLVVLTSMRIVVLLVVVLVVTTTAASTAAVGGGSGGAKELAFVRARETRSGLSWAIWRAQVDGSHQVRLTSGQ